jgi:hypothetical protein
VDPNGDTLNYTAVRLPHWLSFDPKALRLAGIPTIYGVYNVSLAATDAWNASALLSFEIVAGIKPNTPPTVVKMLQPQKAYLKELF